MPSLLEDIALSCACFSVNFFYHTSWGICDPKARKPSGVKHAVLGSSITLYSVKFSKLIFLLQKRLFFFYWNCSSRSYWCPLQSQWLLPWSLTWPTLTLDLAADVESFSNFPFPVLLLFLILLSYLFGSLLSSTT